VRMAPGPRAPGLLLAPMRRGAELEARRRLQPEAALPPPDPESIPMLKRFSLTSVFALELLVTGALLLVFGLR